MAFLFYLSKFYFIIQKRRLNHIESVSFLDYWFQYCKRCLRQISCIQNSAYKRPSTNANNRLSVWVTMGFNWNDIHISFFENPIFDVWWWHVLYIIYTTMLVSEKRAYNFTWRVSLVDLPGVCQNIVRYISTIYE